MAISQQIKDIAEAAGRISPNGAQHILNMAGNGGVGTAIKIAKQNLGIDQALGNVGPAVSTNSGANVQTVQMTPTQYDLESVIQMIAGNAQTNSAFNAQQAELNRQWQQQMLQQQMDFNANEAAKNREWQEVMSNTAYQREINDLKAAGLNPVLAAANGNGAYVGSGATASASVPSGSSAQADTSVNTALVALLGHFLNAQTQLQAADVSAKTNLAVADKYNAMSELIANLNAGVSRYVADVGHSNAELSSEATKIAASLNATAAKYGYDISNLINDKKLAQELLIKELYPDNMYKVLNDVLQHVTGDHSQSGFSSALDTSKSWLNKLLDNADKVFKGNDSQSRGTGRRF